MKISHIGSFALVLSLLTGCASWQGQVAYPNTRFAALPKFEPAAIPKDSQGNESLEPGASPNAGAFVPVLGQVVFGSTALHMMLTSRDTFNWQDPSKFVTVNPAFTSGTWDRAVSGVLSLGSSDISNSVGVKLSAGDTGIPIGGGKAITLKLGVDSSVKLSKLRVARLNLANLDYVRALADAASNNDAYFVGEVLVCDVNSSNLVGFALEYADPLNATFNPTLKTDYEAKYSGVGLVLGASFNKVSSAGHVSFSDIRQPGTPIQLDTLAAIKSSTPHLMMKVDKLRNNLLTFGVSNPNIILSKPFTTTNDSEGNVKVMPINPFMTGTETLVVDKVTITDGKVILSDSGEHEFQYSVVSGNKLYAFRTTLVLKSSTNGKYVEETVENRDVSYLRWEAVDPGSVK